MRQILTPDHVRAICIAVSVLGAVDGRASRMCVKHGENTVRMHFRGDGSISERLVDSQGRLLAIRRYSDIGHFSRINEADSGR